jgi:hypothetical protein
MIAISAIATMLVWNPQASDSESRRSAGEGRLRDHLITYLQTDGLVWLKGAPTSEICARLLSLSNATLTLSAVVDRVSCGPQPPSSSVHASLTVPLDPKVVVLEAWYSAKG